MAENLVTLEELAARWGLSEDVLLDLAGEAKLESVRRGRHRLYPESAVAEYVEAKGLAIDEYPNPD